MEKGEMLKLSGALTKLIIEDVSKERIVILYNALTKEQKKDGKVFRPKLTKKEFFDLVRADPTTRLNGVELGPDTTDEQLSKVKAGKYVQWLIKSFLNPTNLERSPEDIGYKKEVDEKKRVFIEDLYKVTDDLKKYERFKGRLPENKRDISSITPDELFELVKDFDSSKLDSTKSERKSMDVHPGAKLVHDGERWKVYMIDEATPLGFEASCHYGKDSRWCTASPGYTGNFNRYVSQGPLYILFDKDSPTGSNGLPTTRYQFHFQSEQFMDEYDRSINIVARLNSDMSELKPLFKLYFLKSLSQNNSTKIKIDSLTSGNTGKFVALYGLEDLFNGFDPDNLIQIEIYGDDINSFSIPDSISRFKKLKTLTVQKSLISISDKLCELDNLSFISFSKCTRLIEVPECIGNMKNLAFLNLEGTTVDLPSSITDNPNVTDMGQRHFDFTD